MKKRDINEELLQGLEKIAAWRKGQQTLRTTELRRPTGKFKGTGRKVMEPAPPVWKLLPVAGVRPTG